MFDISTDIHVLFIVIHYISLIVNFYETWKCARQTHYAIALENQQLM